METKPSIFAGFRKPQTDEALWGDMLAAEQRLADLRAQLKSRAERQGFDTKGLFASNTFVPRATAEKWVDEVERKHRKPAAAVPLRLVTPERLQEIIAAETIAIGKKCRAPAAAPEPPPLDSKARAILDAGRRRRGEIE